MLNRASRPLGSASNCYICVSCRYRLAKSPKTQLRRQSHATITPVTESDSWFDTINQINDELRSEKTSTEPSKHSSQTAINESEGAGTTSAKTTGNKKSAGTASKVGKSGNGSQTRADVTAPVSKPSTLVEKVKEAKSRAKWGGTDEISYSSKGAKSRLSHDSLRKADKVSPEVVIQSAINKRPYGFHEDSAREDAAAQHPELANAPPRKEESASGKFPGARRRIRERRKAKRSNAASKPAEDISPDTPSSWPTLDSDLAPSSRTLQEAMIPDSEPRQVAKEKKPKKKAPSTPKPAESQSVSTEIDQIHASDLHVQPLDIPQPPVPYLEYGLDRVLFSPGVHQLQDPTSRVYNFDPYLQNIMPVAEFDFSALKEYKTSSEDRALASIAEKHGKKYIGSTSSMTGCLAQFHHLLSSFRPLNLDMLTKNFNQRGAGFTSFTVLSRAPSAIFLRWKDGSYAIDADKEFDSGNVLMLLGKSMELLLTQPRSDYERYRKSDPREVPMEQRTAPESYQYTTMGDFLMRSQLDAYDPRLPNNGTFDLKTRAVVSVRMDAQNYEPMTGYELYTLQGRWGSYEREYYDMMRATMLKYMLQARMGRMNGIFVAYHNVKRIFGFQYVPMRDMDLALHGQVDPSLGDQEFRVSLELLNKLLDKATAKYPRQSLRIHFATRQDSGGGKPLTSLHVFAEPMTESEVDAIQNKSKAKVEEFERTVMGLEKPSPEPGSDDELNAVATSDVDGSSKSKLANDSGNSTAHQSSLGKSTNHATPDPADKEEMKPLFYASLLIKSKVNGEYIYEDRPEKLSQDDEWTVEYLMQEYDVGRAEWAAYEDVKTQRKNAYTNEDEEADDEADTGARKKSDYYIRFLRDMSARGFALRERIDKLEDGKVPVMVGEPLPRVREIVKGVDDYLKELYKAKEVY